jgi:hypothetical protein
VCRVAGDCVAAAALTKSIVYCLNECSNLNLHGHFESARQTPNHHPISIFVSFPHFLSWTLCLAFQVLMAPSHVLLGGGCCKLLRASPPWAPTVPSAARANNKGGWALFV